MSDNEFDDIMKAMPSNISKLDSVYMCFKDEHDKWCDSIKNAYAENNDKGMGEHGLVRLPKDADGEYIHIGDVMEWCDSGETLTVEGIGRDVLFYIDGENAEWTAARNKRHHHAPTVEDVLREFTQAMSENMGLYTGEAIDADEWRDADARTIAKYATKLELREVDA